MVNLALLATEKAFSSAKLSDSIRAISLTDYREFSTGDTHLEEYLLRLRESSDHCQKCSAVLTPNAKFCPECGERVVVKSIISGLLDEPVSALSISDKLKKRVEPHFCKVGNVVQAKREEIMQIPYIKDVRSRIIKNAADEFISG